MYVKSQKERKKTDTPREGWEDGTPPPHRDLKGGMGPCQNSFSRLRVLAGRPKEEKLREAMDADKPDHYEVLGITRSADEAEIKKAAHHPAD